MTEHTALASQVRGAAGATRTNAPPGTAPQAPAAGRRRGGHRRQHQPFAAAAADAATGAAAAAPAPAPSKTESAPEPDGSEAALREWLDSIAAGYAARYADALVDEGYDSITEIQLATEQDLLDAGVKGACTPPAAAIATLAGGDDGNAGSAPAPAATASEPAPPAYTPRQTALPPPVRPAAAARSRR